MQGYVSLKPKDGTPPVAMFRTNFKHVVHKVRGGARPAFNVIGIELAREEKDWRVTAFRTIDMLNDRGTFGTDVRKNDKSARMVTSALRGEVTAVEEGSFTAKVDYRPKPGEPRKFAVDEKTR
jgi:hypothetical protein